jgi:arylsulfatase A-like enzyme
MSTTLDPQIASLLKRILFAIVLPTVALAASCHPRRAINVVLITIDTLRDDHCSVSGYDRETTPHLDRLARQGARMAMAYSPTATTGPTHASIFTSLYPVAHGVVKNGMDLSTDFVTLAETLRDRGYNTAAIVSSFVLDAKFGYDQGFDVFEDDFDPGATSLPRKRFEGHYVDGGFDQPADATTRKALQVLERLAEDDEPFFLFVHYFDPHAPYTPPQPWAARFSSAESGGDALAEMIDAYDGEIAFADNGMGQLLDMLREDGLEQDTLVVVTADHGEGLMQHGHMHHGVQIYEESVRVPLVFRLPDRIAAGRVFHEPVELTDLFPTILDMAGAETDGGLHGRSLAATLEADAPLDPDRPVHLHRRHYLPRVMAGIPVAGEKFGVRVGPWKYVEGEDEGSKELFNLESDPGERHNVRDAHPEIAEALSTRIAAWKTAYGRESALEALSPEDLERLKALGYVE